MRSLLACLAAVAAGPVVAGGLPAPGVYCPQGADVPAISVDAGGIGIDLLDCKHPRISGGRLRADRCYANGGSVVPYDTDLVILPGGDLQHDGVRFRRRDRGPCP
jgi:hypothetical protein